MIKRTSLALAIALPSLLALTPSRAEAQPRLESADYRRLDRHLKSSPQHFAFELRLGTFLPRIDEEPGLSGKPFETIFGDDKRIYVGFEFDWQALRIPYFGTLGPGVSWGYTHMSAKAKLSDSDEESAESTGLAIQPMYLAAVLRIDVLARELSVPLVPYGKAGLGYSLWRSTNDSGTSVRDGIEAKGHSSGTHFALGGMLLLDVFDPSAALLFDENLGVNNSYLYFEWYWSNVGNGLIEDKPQLRVGTSSWVAGVALEF